MNNNIVWMPKCYPSIQNYHTPHYRPELTIMTQNYHQLQRKYEQLKEQYSSLQNSHSSLLEKTTKKRKINRRPDTEIVRSHTCPYQQCKKEYASELALSLYLQQKHSAGTKNKEKFQQKK